MKYKDLVAEVAKTNKMLSIILKKDLKVKVTTTEIMLIYTNAPMYNKANLHKLEILEELKRNNIKKSLIILHDQEREEELKKIKKITNQPKIQKILNKFKISSIKMVTKL